jgi:hypothetical protein
MFALVMELASVSWHFLELAVATMGASDPGMGFD